MATHLNLKDIAVPTNAARLKGFEGYRWLDIRNAIKKAGKESFSFYDFIFELSHPPLVKIAIAVAKEVVRSHEKSMKKCPIRVPLPGELAGNWYWGIFSDDYDSMARRPHSFLGSLVYQQAKRLRNKADDALKEAVRQGLVERRKSPDRNDLYQVTELGWTFCAQKALNPISRARGVALLESVVEKAEAFNQLDGPNWRIEKIGLFGSLFKGAETVNDVDIMVKLRKTDPTLKGRSFRDAEIDREELLWPSSMSEFGNTRKEAFKALRISPHVSLVEFEEMKGILDEDGGAYGVVWTETAGWDYDPDQGAATWQPTSI